MNRLYRRTALVIQRALNQFDPLCTDIDEAIIGKAPPVFILGVPRSGTTLLYQAMARSMDFSVITNLMALAPRFMLRLAPFSNARAPGKDTLLLPGSYGFLPGLHGLSEAGKVMEKWFLPGSSPRHRRQVRQMFAGMTERTGRPVLVKSLSLATRIHEVAETVPEARLVILRRNPRFVVQSLMRGLSDPNVAADQWEGIRPPGYSDFADTTIVRRTAWQVAELTKILGRAQDYFQAERVSRLTYENLCVNPREELARLAAGLGRPIHPSSIPESLVPSTATNILEEEWVEVEAACKEFAL